MAVSMKTLTVLQFLGIFAVYGGLFAGIPALLLHHKLKEETLSVRFFFYLVLGHFYLINLVFFLQLFHSSSQITLILGTLLPLGFSLFRKKRISPKKIGRVVFEKLTSVICGTLGIKLLWVHVRSRIWNKIKGKSASFRIQIVTHLLDWACFIIFTAAILTMYGTNMLYTYGYCASDIPVHNYWINAMGENEIFVNGIYPFGFHCVIYYLHTVFGIETYVLLRLFYVVQVLVIHYVLLAFLKACCKTKYSAWGGAFFYVLAAFLNENTYMRYYSSLPQEFGMLFILPSAYFLFAFLQERKQEVQRFRQMHDDAARKTWKCKSTRYLLGFLGAFALTLTIHFYDTMIAGLFCIGIACGYVGRIFRKEYVGRIFTAGILSIFLAVLPMGIAFLHGTPLQGSLGWGLSVMSKDTQEEDVEIQIDTEERIPSKIQPTAENSGVMLTEEQTQPFCGRLFDIAKNGWRYVWDEVHSLVLAGANFYWRLLVFACEGICLLGGLFFVIFKRPEQGARLLSVGFSFLFFMVLLCAWRFGLPNLMDASRCSIYVAYMIPVVIGFGMDGALTALFGWFSSGFLADIVSFGVSAIIVVLLAALQQIRTPAVLTALEMNEAITCLANIRRENENFKYTICSANDELRMMEDYARHEESITFLRNMEKEAVHGNLTIPTERVYFFIEKIPLDYTVHYEGSGQHISKKGAQMALPTVDDISVYEGENRWIVMSRMYEWAQAFMELYGEEMQVYYETENFVCYVVEQNPYSLYDFSIDYGYNGTR